MLVLMVGYTIISLWILAQPVVEEGAHNAGAAHPDSHGAVTALPAEPPAALPSEAPPTVPPATAALHHDPAAGLEPASARALLQTMPGLPRAAQEAEDFTVRTSVLCYCLEKGPELIRALRRFSGDWYDKGLAALQHQEHDTAVIAFSQTLHRAPRDGRAYFNRALAYARQEKYPQALADLARALALLPHQTEAYALRSLIATLVGDTSQDSQDAQQAARFGEASPLRLP
jgi:tetratricopeptide (TPR) repeat protein